jgi:hypothetical protein
MRKQSELKECDVSFTINGEMFYNILNYAKDLDTDIPIFFYDDRIEIKLMDSTKSSYAKVVIGKDSVMDYNIKKKRAVVLNSKIVNEISVSKDTYIDIKLDTSIMKKIQLKFPNNITILSKLVSPSEIHYGYEKIEQNIKSWSEKKDNGAQHFMLNNEILTRICGLGSMQDQLSVSTHENGSLTINNEDDLIERVMNIDPGSVDTNVTNRERTEFEGDLEEEQEFESEQNSYDNLTDSKVVVEFKELDIYLSKQYLQPLLKLKGLGNILLTIYPDNHPIIIDYVPYNDIKVMQTIALRIPDDE